MAQLANWFHIIATRNNKRVMVVQYLADPTHLQISHKKFDFLFHNECKMKAGDAWNLKDDISRSML